MPFQIFREDDVKIPHYIFKCKRCKEIISGNLGKYCPDCGRKLNKFKRKSNPDFLLKEVYL